MSLNDNKARTSQLYLISMGIGDPDNITLRALKTVEKADVVFASTQLQEKFAALLKNKELHNSGHGLFTSLARRRASEDEVIAMEEETRRLIRDAIAADRIVAVLDYGDPMVYGPQSGYVIEFSDLNPLVIPGVSSFNASNAAIARGLTDGPNSESVILTAAKIAHDGYKGSDSLVKLSETQSTMAFFTMGVDLPEVTRQLKQNYAGNTPIAIVFNAGDSEKQSVLEATLDTIVDKTKGEQLPFEHMIYVGHFLSANGHK
ncbi:MAG: tetrapyrrole methylase [Alcaligenaceae bacterium]|jgi:precorrin-4 methylase|nr:tetrapyrrole methylase [Alcaligenaceae bacterium]